MITITTEKINGKESLPCSYATLLIGRLTTKA